jgi:hypothetical protein
MQPILQMLLKVLDHAERQRRINLAGTINTPDPWQKHRFTTLGSPSTWGGHLRRAENRISAGRDEVRFHERLELRVWVPAAEGGDAGVEPGWRGGLWDGMLVIVIVYEGEIVFVSCGVRVFELVRASGRFRHGLGRRRLLCWRWAGGLSCVEREWRSRWLAVCCGCWGGV